MADPNPDDKTEEGLEHYTTIVSAKDGPEADTSGESDTALLEGDFVGDYQIESLIGVGGGGIVYAARHVGYDQRYAIKTLRAEIAAFPGMLERFKREASMVMKIAHPNIVRIYELGEIAPGRPYYVMELLQGSDLRRLLELCGRFSAKEALEYLEPVCSAVQAAHEAGIVHRDLKATNVWISEVEGKRVVKLLDFGIAKRLSDDASGQGLTRPGATLGTPHHMAPEQIRCERVDERTDVYALGILLFQLITGHYPFNAEDFRQISLLHLHQPPPRPSALARVSPAMDAVVLRALEKQPERRFASARDFLAALRAAADEQAGNRAELPVKAVGVYFEVHTTAEDETDDLAFEDMSNVLDTVEQILVSRDFVFPLRTSNAMLAVQRVPDGADVERAREQAEQLVSELQAILEMRPDPHPGVETAFSLTVGEVFCKSVDRFSIVGGPLLKVSNWTTHHRVRDEG